MIEILKTFIPDKPLIRKIEITFKNPNGLSRPVCITQIKVNKVFVTSNGLYAEVKVGSSLTLEHNFIKLDIETLFNLLFQVDQLTEKTQDSTIEMLEKLVADIKEEIS